jgi:hypothetical protein
MVIHYFVTETHVVLKSINVKRKVNDYKTEWFVRDNAGTIRKECVCGLPLYHLTSRLHEHTDKITYKEHVMFFQVKLMCGLVGRSQHFIEACFLHLQGSSPEALNNVFY